MDPGSVDNLMVLPHLHKHDLFKKQVYQKPSTWICGGYFTEAGCLSSFNWMFKNIDFEFPHYECEECEFQVWCDCAKYYAENLEPVKFLHRSYNVPYHAHPVKLELGSERKNWKCSGIGLPNKCLSSQNGESILGAKKWTCESCNVLLCYPCVKRRDIENVDSNYMVHEHYLYKSDFLNYFRQNESIFWDGGEKSWGIGHEIDSQQKLYRCEPWNFNCCEECFQTICQSQKEDELAHKEASMLNESISNLESNQVVYIINHPHPLYQEVDSDALCENAKVDKCLSLENKTSHTEPVYFKWVKTKCDFQLWALCTSPYVKKVKTLKGKTWVIF